MKYDLHIHSALSPCANDDMTPANVAGMAKLAGADIIAVTDHNSALNLPAVKAACDAYDLKLLPGIEVNTQEEIHVLCYFSNVDTALKFSELLYEHLPAFPYDEEIWGRQLVMDENDEILRTVPKLLTGALDMDIYEVKAACEAAGGICVPAHIDADSYSILSVLGFFPDDIVFDTIEVKFPDRLDPLLQKGFVPRGCNVITSSDAHQLDKIAENLKELPKDTSLWQLIDGV